MALAANTQAQTVTNFSNFSESGTLLLAPNNREQKFTPSGTSVTVTTATSPATTSAGQETYLTDEVDTLTTGYRITVDLTSATFKGSSAETIGLVVASTETPNTQPNTRGNLLIWGWRGTSMWVGNFDGSSPTAVYGSESPAYPGTVRPDSVFIERTATG